MRCCGQSPCPPHHENVTCRYFCGPRREQAVQGRYSNVRLLGGGGGGVDVKEGEAMLFANR